MIYLQLEISSWYFKMVCASGSTKIFIGVKLECCDIECKTYSNEAWRFCLNLSLILKKNSYICGTFAMYNNEKNNNKRLELV